MDVDVPAALQGGGTITWLQLQGLFTRRNLSELARYWEANQGTNILDASSFDIPTVRDYFLLRRLPA